MPTVALDASVCRIVHVFTARRDTTGGHQRQFCIVSRLVILKVTLLATVWATDQKGKKVGKYYLAKDFMMTLLNAERQSCAYVNRRKFTF